MKVPEFKQQSIVFLQMPYEFYKWVLYCMATYDNPTDPDMKELQQKCWDLTESLGAESPHHFIAENDGFMSRYREQLVAHLEEVQKQVDRLP